MGCTMEAQTMISNSTQCDLLIGEYKKYTVSGVTFSFKTFLAISNWLLYLDVQSSQICYISLISHLFTRIYCIWHFKFLFCVLSSVNLFALKIFSCILFLHCSCYFLLAIQISALCWSQFNRWFISFTKDNSVPWPCCANVSRLQTVVYSHRNSFRIHCDTKELNNTGEHNRYSQYPSRRGGELHMPGHQQLWDRWEAVCCNKWWGNYAFLS